MTFARACSHMTNYTAAHEGNAGEVPHLHLSYPNRHIEVDNRLSWFLGPLHELYPDARYVHLRRDPEAVAQSFLKRWPPDPTAISFTRHPVQKVKRALVPHWRPGQNPSSGIVPAFAYPMMARNRAWPAADRLPVCRHYVKTVTSNIEHFLADKPSQNIDIESAGPAMEQLWDWIGAEGDLTGTIAELQVRHNHS